jgi:hypothetical protein
MSNSTYSNRTKIANSFNKGQGSQPDLCEKLDIEGLKVDYLNGVLSFNYCSQGQKDVHHAMLFNALLKDKSIDYIERLFKHLESGEYLSLNHGIVTTQTSIDKYKQFSPLFTELGITRAESNGKGSKLHRLYCVPSPYIVDSLAAVGIITHDVLTDNYMVVGLKVELPKIEA